MLKANWLWMRILQIILVLLLTIPGWCQGNWTHEGTTWKHSNGMQITFPADFQAEAAKDGILNVTGKQGFVSFAVQGMKGEKLFKSWVAGQQKALDSEGLKLKDLPNKTLKNGILVRTSETQRMSEQEILFVIASVALSKGQDYLCMQIFYPKEREKDWGPLMSATINSVKR